MKRSTIRSISLSLAALLCAGLSDAATAEPSTGVPETMQITARIQDGGAPATGAHGFAFRLYTQATGGEPVWKEDDVTLAVQDGLLSRELGTVTPLPPVLTGVKLYLELVVDGITLSPRMLVTSAPYAIRAGTAAKAERLGELAPGDVARVNAAGAVQGGHTAESWFANRTGAVISKDWTAIPGLSIPFELSGRANVIMQASGEQLAIGPGDAKKLGNDTHGQRIVVSRADVAWWTTWAFSYAQTLEPGKHTITVETHDTGGTTPSQCAVCGDNGTNPDYTQCNMSILATYL
jgi:hypothetical protein